MNQPFFSLRLPDWLDEQVRGAARVFPTTQDRMSFAIVLSRLNIRHGTGGPFAAVIFRMDEWSVFAAGVNLVTSGNCSVLHAEITAIVAAQQKAGTYDLSSEKLPKLELVSSTEPCAMCLGAVAWSGVRSLVCGARGEDAEGSGFDEGEKPDSWEKALKRRGIAVVRDVCREQASAVLEEYRTSGGIIYNPRASGVRG